ncbi:MAG: hypothetical protein KatS3mg023_3632 [Armatimonadota bacterium]|nr:MAG: hypothetical protein KatS3mg023_3632 [Armatimonadota bacterium]
MSAFVVNKIHIDLIVQSVLHGTEDGEHEAWMDKLLRQDIARYLQGDGVFTDELGQCLLDQNVRSVLYRYNGDESMIPDYAKQPYRFEPLPFRPTIVELLKALDCYEYQSCESPDWEGSSAYRIVQSIRRHIIRCLPGYDEAPWSWGD